MSVVSEANETFANVFDLSNASGWNQSLIDDHSTYDHIEPLVQFEFLAE